MYVCDAAKRTGLPHSAAKSVSTADATEMAGQLAILEDFGVILGAFWAIFGLVRQI